MSVAPYTEIVHAESISVGERIVAPNGAIWRVLVVDEDVPPGERCQLTMTREGDPNAVEVTRDVHRFTKYEVICKVPSR